MSTSGSCEMDSAASSAFSTSSRMVVYRHLPGCSQHGGGSLERPVATPEQWETQANGQRRESRPQQPGGGAHCQSRRWCGCQQRTRRGSSAAAHRPWLPWAPCCLAGRRGCLMAVGAAASSAGNAAAALRSAGTPIAADARLPGFCGCPAGASTLGRRRASPCKETWAYFTSHWTACRFNMPAQNARSGRMPRSPLAVHLGAASSAGAAAELRPLAESLRLIALQP